jgi:hypothetical protein
MSLNDSTVEDAAPTWCGDLSRFAPTLTPALSHGERESYGDVERFRFAPTLTPALSHGERESYGDVERFRFAPTLTPTLSHRERESYGEVVLVGRLREAIRRLDSANACGGPHPASPKGRGEEGRATPEESLSVQIERRSIP